MKVEIIPSILEPDEQSFRSRYLALLPHIKLVQLDVLDGSFLPFENFHDPQYIDLLKTKMQFEIHLMIEPVVDKLAMWNRTWVKRIYFHIESISNAVEIISSIRTMGKEVGLALNPETDAEAVESLVESVDGVLIMTVHPGRGGQEFLSGALTKVRKLRAEYPNLDIEVDGGISNSTIHACVEAGANLLVVGSGIRNITVKEDIYSLNHSIQA